MKIHIRTTGFKMRLPIPIGLVGTAIRLMPQSALLEMRKSVPEPYWNMLTKEFLYFIYKECRDILREYHGIEIIHVEASDGTYVSIKL